jgi:ParB family chromosome partitioning protein
MHLAKIGINELREPAHVARASIDGEGIDELAESIRRVGVIQPLVVMEVDGGYEVVAGHRRLLAARRVGLVALPCLVRSARDADPTALKLHENLYRQELTPVEEAAFFAELLPTCENDTDNLAALVKQSRTYVENRLLLLKGDPDVLAAVAQREISLGVAEELNKIPDPKDRVYYLGWAKQTGATRATVRQWRATLAAQSTPAPAAEAPGGAPPPPITPTRDVFECFLCGQSEPKTDLEFWHIHRHCRLGVEARAKARESEVGSRKFGGADADAK